jgi:TolB-like protein/class 3 adenylate cyclase/cytochrome c-type biogenesis protein CcmH/NrfG
MSAEPKGNLRLEIGHVLFIDIVGYSQLSINEQSKLLGELNDVVRGTEHFRSAEAEGNLVRLPTGDGMALVFYNSPEEPARCALEISQALKAHPELRVRMGIHSGPVNQVADVNERTNIAGAGINIAQRVMDCGDAGHILLSKHVAEDLQHYSELRPHLHEVGQTEVKHREVISIVNLYTPELGNPNPPRLKQAATEVRRRRRNAFLLAGSSLVVLVAVGFFVLPHAAARKIDKSIAVLPFENLSAEKENAYFADGIQDDILTNLSKIGDLKVISRTSVMSYRGHAPNIREIAKLLGVSTVLEGSVRREGNRVRVNVQLINANNDEHIWANNYDRDLTDVFAIQTDLAQRIATELQAKLSPSEKATLTQRPTQNGEAYLAFIRGHDLQGAYEDIEKLKQAEQMYQHAVELDPNFALAYARYSQLESWLVHTFERTPDRRNKARMLVQRAIQLQPELPEAHLALGFASYYVDSDFDTAAKEFEIAQRGLPNEAESYLALGAIQRRQGKWSESTANLERATSLSPKDVWMYVNLAENYEMLRDFAAADRTIDRALDIDPKSLAAWETKAKLGLEEKGDFAPAEKALTVIDALPKTPDLLARLTSARINIYLYQRKFAEAVREAESVPDKFVATFPGALCGKYTAIGAAKKALHDEAGAREVFLKAKAFAEKDTAQNPDDAEAHARFAEALAWLNDKDGALAEIKRAAELLPESKDAFGGPEITSTAAEIHAILGDAGGVVEILDGLLNRPSTITVPMLKINPIWDFIRGDPRFQALIDKYSAKA